MLPSSHMYVDVFVLVVAFAIAGCFGGATEQANDGAKLMQAIRNNDIKLARSMMLSSSSRLLQKKDAGVNGKTFLMQAVQSRSYTLAKELIQQGIDVNAADPEGKTALHYAAVTGNASLVRLLLLDGKANVDTVNSNDCDRTPLMTCLSSPSCNAAIVLLLMNASASIEATDCDGMTPKNMAKEHADDDIFLAFTAGCLRRGNEDCFDYLWDEDEQRNRGIDTINQMFGDPPKNVLMHVIESGKMTMLRKILELGVEPSEPIYTLNLAVKVANLAMIKLLISFSATVFAKSPACDQTLLMDCALTLSVFDNACTYDTFRYLLRDKKAPRGGINCLGQSLKDIARLNNDPRFIKELDPNGTSISTGTTTPTARTTTPKTQRCQGSDCKRCGWFVPEQKDESGGISTTSRGRRVKIASPSEATYYPWMAKIDVFYEKDEGKEPFCGGSLITSQWVLTAAHCVSRNNGLDRPYTISVKLGSQFAKQMEEGAEIRAINANKSVHIHPKFAHDSFENDFALLRLNRPVPLSSRISAICLPDHPIAMCQHSVDIDRSTVPQVDSCQNVITAGWGGDADNTMPLTLQSISLSVSPYKECQSKMNNAIYDNMLCAASQDKGRGETCSGDSGGPLMCVHGNRTFLVGVVSWGMDECGTNEIPGVYSRVCQVLDWIKATTDYDFANGIADDVRFAAESKLFGRI